VLAAAGYYDERFFIYGNERDLASRVLNLGFRILQYPRVITRHGTPFGMKMGARSLYYHVRNFWLYAFKHAPLEELLKFPFGFLARRMRRGGDAGAVRDAVGSIGLLRNIRETPGGWWIVARATLAALWNLPYCLKRRAPCSAADFEMPVL
jgi:GT2 family glycosyltransferase